MQNQLSPESDRTVAFDTIGFGDPGFFELASDSMVYFYAAIALAGVLVHAMLALWVYDDACRLIEQNRDRRVLVSRPWVWLLATLAVGLLSLVAYWAIHRSMLSPRVVRELENGEQDNQ